MICPQTVSAVLNPVKDQSSPLVWLEWKNRENHGRPALEFCCCWFCWFFVGFVYASASRAAPFECFFLFGARSEEPSNSDGAPVRGGLVW